MFEAAHVGYESCAWVNLTYADEHLPEGGNLSKTDVQLWMKRLRKTLAELSGGQGDPVRVRYFLVGEYGEEKGRPHYHCSLFGAPASLSALYAETWGKGSVRTFEFNHLTAQYTAGYVVKKLTNKDNPLLKGRSPEFALMSRMPGIGSLAMKTIADSLKQNPAALLSMQKTLDVPDHLRIGPKKVPLGRFLRKELRKHFGMTEDDVKAATMNYQEEIHRELQALYDAAPAGETHKETFLEAIHQQIIMAEAKALLWKKKGSL